MKLGRTLGILTGAAVVCAGVASSPIAGSALALTGIGLLAGRSFGSIFVTPATTACANEKTEFLQLIDSYVQAKNAYEDEPDESGEPMNPAILSKAQDVTDAIAKEAKRKERQDKLDKATAELVAPSSPLSVIEQMAAILAGLAAAAAAPRAREQR